MLQQRPLSADELCKYAEISQATLSRTIQELSDRIVRYRIPGRRTPMYAAPRPILSVDSPQPIFRVDIDGVITEAGGVCFLSGARTLQVGDTTKIFEGLPPAMNFASPSGYLGRLAAEQVADSIAAPPRLRDWSDDDRIRYLCNYSEDAPGNLVWGRRSFARFMERRNLLPIAQAEVDAVLLERVNAAVQAGNGSSAGGEQPKFTCEVEHRGHLIVKFAKAQTRAADLLYLEELALSALQVADIQAASARARQVGDYVMLEVDRFDRVGRFGRRGVISAGALDDEMFGHRDSWPKFAQRCLHARLITREQHDTILTITAFSELIGNQDMHFENLSLLVDDNERPTGVTPAYDILPMRYWPSGGGLEPPLNVVTPQAENVGSQPAIWTRAFAAADAFWRNAAEDGRISQPMRHLAHANVGVVANFVAPLIPR